MVDDTGAVTAEFAVAMPAVLVILVFSLGLIASQIQDLRLQQVSSVVARALGRGEPDHSVKAWLKKNVPDAVIATANSDGVFCATLKQRLRVGISLPRFDLQEKSCVWVGQSVAHD